MRTQPILSNPEFQRNLWQELTTHRLIGGLVILSILAWLTFLLNDTHFFDWILFGLIFIWGIKTASESISEEFQHSTWDYQRISAITPFKFTWGKLLGSTSYTWYLSSISFLYFIGLGLHFNTPLITLLQKSLGLILCGLLGQYLAMLFSLNSIQFGRDKICSFRYFIFSFFISTTTLTLLSPESYNTIEWYNLNIRTYPFFLILSIILLTWSILGSYRLIRSEFQYKNQLPYAWFGFCLFWIIYIPGFNPLNTSEMFLDKFTLTLNEAPVLYSRSYMAFFTGLILLYISLFSQKYEILSYKKLRLFIREKNYLATFSALPRWIIAGLFFSFLYINFMIFGNIMGSQLLVQGSVFGSTILLLSIRDILLVHFFYFSSNPKRALLSSSLYFSLLYFVLPALFLALNVTALNAFLLPSFKQVSLLGWCGLFAQIGLLAWLVRNRFYRIQSA